MSERNDVHRQAGVAAAELSDSLIEPIGIIEADQDVRQLVRMTKDPLSIGQTHIDKTILSAVNGLQDSADDPGLAWLHSASNSPTVVASGLSADQPFTVVFGKFSRNAPGALECKNVGIDADINRLRSVVAIE